MNSPNHDIRVYKLAWEFVLGLKVPGISRDLLGKYLYPPCVDSATSDIPVLYRQILESAQNSNMKTGVVGKAIGGVSMLAPVLFGFDPQLVLSNFAKPEDVLNEVIRTLQPKGKIRTTSRSLWPQFCSTILSAATFLAQFKSGKDFHEWVRFFDSDDRARPALPLLLAREIDGLGFALACDFLKDTGYLNFGKPDIHLKFIFTELELSQSESDFDVFRAITRVANSVSESPYCVDKLFWLIGSGRFYADPQIGNNGKIGSQKAAFVDYAKSQLATAT